LKEIVSLLDFLNNASVAAFVGAFSAFFLVVANDWRRNRQKMKLIRNEIRVNKGHAKDKLETIKRNRTLVTEHNQIISAPIVKFNSPVIKQLATEILDRFSTDQRRALDAICYTLEATDSVLDSAFDKTQKINDHGRKDLIDRLLVDYNDAIVNLGRLIEMCENYERGEFRIIVTKQYNRRDYEQ
jgi:hypothetical protein